MEKKTDIIPFLEGIVEENTRSYRSDFDYDKKRLAAAMLEARQEDRTFLWMSRPCGTWIFLEREVFLRGTPAHTTWTYQDYVADAEHIKAFRVIVAPGQLGGFVLGKIQPLNYGEQVRRVQRSALHVQTVEMIFGDEAVFTVSFADYPDQFRKLTVTHGELKNIRYAPESEAELSCVLQAERTISATRKRASRPRKPQLR